MCVCVFVCVCVCVCVCLCVFVCELYIARVIINKTFHDFCIRFKNAPLTNKEHDLLNKCSCLAPA